MQRRSPETKMKIILSANHLETLIVPPALYSKDREKKSNSKCIRWKSPSASPDSSPGGSEMLLRCFCVNATQSFEDTRLYAVALRGRLAALPKICQTTGNAGCSRSCLHCCWFFSFCPAVEEREVNILSFPLQHSTSAWCIHTYLHTLHWYLLAMWDQKH